MTTKTNPGRAALPALAAVAACAWLAAQARTGAHPPQEAPPTRDLAAINWMDFQASVPSRCDTVLLPTGTLEPHGVINNGADITAPVAMARAIADEVNAMIAPAIPYGITGSMDAFPGAFSISEPAYRAYVADVLRGLARCGFKTIVILNGHGGPQTAVLNDVAAQVGREARVRTLVVNWWAYASDVTLEVFGEDGGHAGWNETAYIQAIDKALVHPEKYDDDLATPNPGPGTYSAYPAPSSIGLYKPGQGYPKFEQAKADAYFAKVNKKVAALILDMRRKWDKAGL
jgi:creatinine amidohydrolase